MPDNDNWRMPIPIRNRTEHWKRHCWQHSNGMYSLFDHRRFELNCAHLQVRVSQHFHCISVLHQIASFWHEWTRADPGFWSRGPAKFWPERGALSPKFAQNREFSLKFAWKLYDFEKKILGARGPGPPGSASGETHSETWVILRMITIQMSVFNGVCSGLITQHCWVNWFAQWVFH